MFDALRRSENEVEFVCRAQAGIFNPLEGDRGDLGFRLVDESEMRHLFASTALWLDRSLAEFDELCHLCAALDAFQGLNLDLVRRLGARSETEATLALDDA